MGESVTLELPAATVRSAREVAARTHRRIEDVLIDWIDQSAANLPVESLSDAEVLALTEIKLDLSQQKKLNELLTANREGNLTEEGRMELDELMRVYRRGLVQKARALKVSVERGLKPPISAK